MRALMQMTDKEIEDMSLDELRIERMVHTWAAKKWENAIFALNRRTHWDEENVVPIDIEEEKAKLERGEIPQTLFASRSYQYHAQKRKEKATTLMLEYAKQMMNHEKSISAMLIEQIDNVNSKRKKPKRKTGPKTNDPRRVASRNNPKGDWKERHPTVKALKPLKAHRNYWTEVQQKDKAAETALKRMAPIVTWDYDKLKSAARAAGFYTDELIAVNIARELELSIKSTNLILRTGKMTWGQAMLIGALFEMTPALFCDVFLNGYFKEIAEGRYIAQVDNKEALRVLK